MISVTACSGNLAATVYMEFIHVHVGLDIQVHVHSTTNMISQIKHCYLNYYSFYRM